MADQALPDGAALSEALRPQDRVSWVIPCSWLPASNKAGVYGPPSSREKFEVIYTGPDSVPPTGFRYLFSSPELLPIRSGSLRCLQVRMATDKQKKLVARIAQGQAEIDSRYNPASDMDWIADTLCSKRPAVGYLSVRLLPSGKPGSLAVCPTSVTNNSRHKTYTFGVHRARAAIVQAKKNWHHS